MSFPTDTLQRMMQKAERTHKPPNVIYMIQSMVGLGSGWHSFKEVLTKAVELSGNAKLKYYPIQDAVKSKLEEIDAPKGVPMSEIRVRIKPELYGQISEFIHNYLRE